MLGHYIAAKTFEHPIVCFCQGGVHSFVVTFKEGDVIVVTNVRKYNSDKGWYIKIVMNAQYYFYLNIGDLEQSIMDELLLSMVDIDLKINYVHYRINNALDTGDKTTFMVFTQKLKELKEIKGIFNEYLAAVPV